MGSEGRPGPQGLSHRTLILLADEVDNLQETIFKSEALSGSVEAGEGVEPIEYSLNSFFLFFFTILQV